MASQRYYEKYVEVNGYRWKVPARWRGNAWFMAAFADGIAAALEQVEKGKGKK